MTQHGIDKLTVLVKTLAQLISTAVKVDANKDGKIDAVEIFSIAQFVVVKAISVYGSLDGTVAEFKDLDAQEKKQLIEAFNEEFNLPNVEVEKLIEEWLVVINQLATLSTKTLNHFKKN
jgi:hypothetical protein